MAGQVGTGGERDQAVRADNPAAALRESSDAVGAAGAGHQSMGMTWMRIVSSWVSP